MADPTAHPAPTTAAGALLDAPAPAPVADAPVVADAAGADPAPPGDAPAEQPALKMPGKDATPEDWSAFYSQIGRPETPEAYELPVPEGDLGEFAKEAAPMMHKAGLTTEQAKVLATEWNGYIAKQTEAAAKAEADQQIATAAKNTAEAAALQNEWGQAHSENMELAKRAVRQFMPGDKAAPAIAALESVLGYKGAIQFLHGIGKGLGEGDAAGMGGTSGNLQTPMQSLASRLYAK